jgi:hypothetical protein
MSDIKGNNGVNGATSAKIGPDAPGTSPIIPFPYRIYTDYGNQYMSIVVPGTKWTGNIEPIPPATSTPIEMSVTAGEPAQNSTVYFSFKLAPPGSEGYAKLNDGTNTYGMTVSVPKMAPWQGE